MDTVVLSSVITVSVVPVLSVPTRMTATITAATEDSIMISFFLPRRRIRLYTSLKESLTFFNIFITDS